MGAISHSKTELVANKNRTRREKGVCRGTQTALHATKLAEVGEEHAFRPVGDLCGVRWAC